MFKLGNWSDTKTLEMISDESHLSAVKFIWLDATKSSLLTWFSWGILEKMARKLYPLFQRSVPINALANSRRAFQIKIGTRKLKNSYKPHLISAHNLGALYPAYKLSRKWNVPFIFDIEDYHPGEFIKYDKTNEKQRREYLMRSLLPKVAAITFASPLIGEHTMDLIEGQPNHRVVVNSFPEGEFQPPKPKGNQEPLRLVWFSQKISYGRGLEQLFAALKLALGEDQEIKKNFELSLIGEPDPQFNKKVIIPFTDEVGGTFLSMISPLSQRNLHLSLAWYDIGLALEFTTRDLNRQLCLTNKIFAYTQAGLYILATNTPAQQQFIERNPWAGTILGQSVNELKEMLIGLSQNKQKIRQASHHRYTEGNKMAWEHEGNKILRMTRSIFKNGNF